MAEAGHPHSPARGAGSSLGLGARRPARGGTRGRLRADAGGLGAAIFDLALAERPRPLRHVRPGLGHRPTPPLPRPPLVPVPRRVLRLLAARQGVRLGRTARHLRLRCRHARHPRRRDGRLESPRVGPALPGAVGYGLFLCYYLDLGFVVAAQRDWHASFFAVLGLFALEAFPGRRGRVASALAYATALRDPASRRCLRSGVPRRPRRVGPTAGRGPDPDRAGGHRMGLGAGGLRAPRVRAVNRVGHPRRLPPRAPHGRARCRI